MHGKPLRGEWGGREILCQGGLLENRFYGRFVPQLYRCDRAHLTQPEETPASVGQWPTPAWAARL